MGLDLFAKQVLATYDSLLKVGDNDTLTGTPKRISDGRGNDSPIWLGTTRIGIGLSPESGVDLQTNIGKFGSLITTSLRIDGSLTDSLGSIGSENQVLISTGSATRWASISAVSGVSGTGTTNTIPLWTSGTSIGNSLITQSGSTIDINGKLYADLIQLSGGIGDQGTLSWNANEETLDLVQNGTTHPIGQAVEIHCKNQTGSTIASGTPVYVTGTLGASGRLKIAPMIADASIPAKFFIGVTTEAILNGDDGKVIAFGKIRGLNTSAYTEGQTLWVSSTNAGLFQTTRPSAPNLDLEVAIVINSHHNNGTIFVRSNIGHYLGTAHDVNISSVAENDLLVYKTNRWVNSKTIGDLSAANVTLSGYLRGPEIFVIDPAEHGNKKGLVQILGDLRVDGITTTINSETISVSDKNITLAKDAATAGDANGAGITIAGASATLTYLSASDDFTFNKNVNASRFVGPLNGDVTGNADTADALSAARNIALDGSVTGNADFDGSGNITITTTTNHNHDDRYYTETEVGNFFSGTTAITGYNKTNWDAAYSYSQIGHLPLTGGTLTGDLTLDDKLTITGTTNNFVIDEEADGTWHLYDTFQDNGIVLYSGSGGMDFQYMGVTEMTIDGSGVSFTGTINLDAADLNIGSADIIFGTAAAGATRGLIWSVGGSFLSKLIGGGADGGKVTLFANMDDAITTGNIFEIKDGSTGSLFLGLSHAGILTAGGGTSTQWNTAYTYSQVGHLPLAGGTLTGDLQVGAKVGTVDDQGIYLRGVGDSTHKLYYNSAISANIWEYNTNILFQYYNAGTPATRFTFATNGNFTATGTLSATGGNSTNWNTAYGWGNHADEGYLTSVTNIPGHAATLYREDNRTISPNELTAGQMRFGFTSWNNNNTSPYADFLHLRSYTDASGGADNLVMFNKGGSPAMRIWTQSWGSATAYSSYVDVITSGNISTQSVAYASNAGTLDSLVSGQFLRSDQSDTMAGSLTIAGNLTIGTGGSNDQLQIRHGSGVSDYGAIRFFEAGVNQQTIHAFSTNWQSGNVYASGGAINIAGDYGVTIGTWPDPDVVFVDGGSSYFKNKVGIGLTSPVAKLHVKGGTLTTSSETTYPLWLSDGGDTTKALILGYDLANDVGVIQAVDQGVGWKHISIAPTDGRVGVGTVAPLTDFDVVGNVFLRGGVVFMDELRSYTGDQLKIQNGGNNTLFVDAKLGVGTSTMSNNLGKTLQINTTTTLMGYVGNSYFLNNWYYDSGGQSKYMTSGYASGYIQNGDGEHRFFTSAAGAAFENASVNLRAIIKNNGNFGINTDTPIDKFHIVGGLTSTGLSDTLNGAIGSIQIGYDGAKGVIRTWNSSPLLFSVYNYYQWDVSGSLAMYISTSRNVGIGTDSPGVKLDVIGQIRGSSLIVDGTYDGNFGYIGASWGGSDVYPTLYSSHPDRWVMLINPHISYTQNGVSGFTGSTTGANIQFAGNPLATTSWQLGVGSNGVGNDKFSIGRQGSPILVADNSGRIGIGVTSPAAKLDVNGSAYFGSSNQVKIIGSDNGGLSYYAADGTSLIINTEVYNNPIVFRINSVEQARITSTNTSIAGTLSITKGASDTIQAGSSVYLVGGSGSSYTQLQQGVGRFTIWGFNGGSWGEKMTIRHSDGNVGIGVTSPTVKLHVADSGGGRMILQGLGGSGINWQFNSYTDGKLYIGNYGVADYMTLTSTGLVGIGTTDPQARLHVAENNPQIAISRIDGLGPLWKMYGWGEGLNIFPDEASTVFVGRDGSATNFQLYNGNFSALGTGTSYFMGNLGVGTSTAGEKLTVNGNIKLGVNGANDRLDIFHGNSSSHYGAIRFYGGGTNISTIHSFPTSWQGTNVYSSAGAINITGANGVTLGAWPDPDAVFITGGVSYFKRNVAIGITTTTSKLHVVGNTRLENGPDNALQIHTTVLDNNTRDGIFLYEGDGQASGRQAISWYNGNQSYYKARLWTEVGSSYGATQFGIDVANDSKVVATRLYIRNGNTFVNGTFTASGDVYAYSDARVKENVKTIDNALDKVVAMRGVSYNRTDDDDKTKKVGVIAQEIQKVLPEVVSEQEDGMLRVSYGNIVGVLIEAIKEQQKQIDELKALLNVSPK